MLASTFRVRGLPVVLVNVAGAGVHGRTDAQEAEKPRRVRPEGWTELTTELDPQPDDHRVTKTTWGAFYGTDLHAYLQEQGVTQVVVGGVATSIGVESTARAAFEHGYHVVLVTDAMTDGNTQAHENSISHVSSATRRDHDDSRGPRDAAAVGASMTVVEHAATTSADPEPIAVPPPEGLGAPAVGIPVAAPQ